MSIASRRGMIHLRILEAESGIFCRFSSFVFSFQEVDGRALLLMSRNDVLTGLRLKLGPALKIYHLHISKLQSRTDFVGM